MPDENNWNDGLFANVSCTSLNPRCIVQFGDICRFRLGHSYAGLALCEIFYSRSIAHFICYIFRTWNSNNKTHWNLVLMTLSHLIDFICCTSMSCFFYLSQNVIGIKISNACSSNWCTIFVFVFCDVVQSMSKIFKVNCTDSSDNNWFCRVLTWILSFNTAGKWQLRK